MHKNIHMCIFCDYFHSHVNIKIAYMVLNYFDMEDQMCSMYYMY